jgi:hypothetical protein
MSTSILERIDADLVEPQRLASSVIDQLRVEQRRPRRDDARGITTREALQALVFEAQIVSLCAENQARGIVLTDADRARLLVSWGLIETIYAEVVR